MAGALYGCGRPAAERPNLLLVTLDTTRPDYLGVYGYPTPTPGFDELAREGVRFDAALSSSGLTPASHASLLTGLYPFRHGVRVLSADAGFRLSPDQPTLTTLLRDSGYSTGSVNSAFPVASHFGFDHGFDTWESVEGQLKGRGKGWDVGKLQRRSDVTTDIAIDLVGDLPEPFFLWVHYWDPHDLALVPPPAALPEPGTVDSPDDLYAAEVRFVGQQFGRLCDSLRESGAWDRTVVVVTADHGEGLSDGVERHGWAMHRMLYQEQLRVPLLLAGPGVPAGRVVGELVRSVDVAPTVLDLLGLPRPTDLDGSSLRPLIEGRPDAPRWSYAEQINGYDRNAGMVKKRPDAAFMYCVVEDGWKLVYRPHMIERSELFHLDRDPLELENLFQARPDVRATLLTKLAHLEPWALAPFTADAADESADATEALAALGYAIGSASEVSDWRWTCPFHLDHRQDDRSPHAGCGEPPIPVQDGPWQQ